MSKISAGKYTQEHYMAQAIKKKTMVKKKKSIREVTRGRVNIYSTFNNTLVNVCDQTGNVIAWSSAGAMGFKGARKSTPYAAQLATKTAVDKAKQLGLKEVQIFISGVGPGREQAIRGLQGTDIAVTGIKDVTPVAHGGCRPKKPRRV